MYDVPKIRFALAYWLIFFLVIQVCMSRVGIVFAQDSDFLPGETPDQPKERTVQITARVQDNEPPSTPILISPENESTVGSGSITFVWKESTDNFAVDHYVLVVDGNTSIDSIPTGATTTATYTLTYDSVTGYFSITPKATLSDGAHTWKISAVDTHGNTATSVTWTFTIDTQAPVFVITNIGDQIVTISAQDVSTIPTSPVQLSKNEPLLIGTGEASSDVIATVSLPGNATKTYTFTIDANGQWQLQLDTLPKDVVLTISFQITDQAGHLSVLTDVPFIIKTKKIVVPVPGTPPGTTVEIPVATTTELVYNLSTNIAPYVPPPLQQLIKDLPVHYRSSKESSYYFLLNSLVLLLLLVLPILKTIFLSLKFGSNLTLKDIGRIWQLIGLVPGFRPQGIVVERTDQTAVPFARITFSGNKKDLSVVTYSCLTNKEGIYSLVGLESGEYRASIKDERILFPTLVKSPSHLTWDEYYTGISFTIPENCREPHLVIPVENLDYKPFLFERLKYWVLERKMANLFLLTISIIITFLFPTLLNCISLAVYLGIILWDWFNHKTHTVGTILNQDRMPVKNTVVIIEEEKTEKVLAITQSNAEGQVTISQVSSEAEALFIDFNYQLQGGDRSNGLAISSSHDQVFLLMAIYPQCIIPSK